MDDEQTDGGGFKVVDRRRFTETGESRQPDVGEQEERSEPVRPAAAPQPPRAEASPSAAARPRQDGQGQPTQAGPSAAGGSAVGSARDDLSVDFSGFIVSLATQTLMLLGEMPNPESGLVTANYEAARQTIDILDLLADKTRGNLTAEEAQLLNEVLTSLRMAYVRKVRSA